MSTEIAGQGNYNAYAGSAQVIAKGPRKLINVQTARNVPQITTKVPVKLQANTVPWLAFMQKLKRTFKVAQPKYTSLLSDILPRTFTYGTSTGETTGTTLTFAGGATPQENLGMRPGDILFVERTREHIRVLTVNAGADSITCTRGFGTGGGAAATINDAEVIQLQGNAQTENSLAPDGISSEPNMIDNYCQTFRESWEASGRDVESENFGGDEWPRIQKDANDKMDMDIEEACLFNEALNSTDPTMTKGLLGWISTNSTNQAGVLDEVSLSKYVQGFMRHNVGRESDCIHFCGDNARLAMDAFGRDALRLRTGDSVLGVAIESWQSSFGKMKLMQHALMTALGGNQTAANRGRVGMIIGINLGLVAKVAFKGREKFLQKGVQTPGTDGVKDVLTADIGFQCLSEKSQAIMYGITG